MHSQMEKSSKAENHSKLGLRAKLAEDGRRGTLSPQQVGRVPVPPAQAEEPLEQMLPKQAPAAQHLDL